jgi:hypothetical protein
MCGTKTTEITNTAEKGAVQKRVVNRYTRNVYVRIQKNGWGSVIGQFTLLERSVMSLFVPCPCVLSSVFRDEHSQLQLCTPHIHTDCAGTEPGPQDDDDTLHKL